MMACFSTGLSYHTQLRGVPRHDVRRGGGLSRDRTGPASRTEPRLRARPVSGVEARTSEARTGDHGAVRFAARRVCGVEPLAEELAQPLLTGAAMDGQPLVEGGLELGL